VCVCDDGVEAGRGGVWSVSERGDGRLKYASHTKGKKKRRERKYVLGLYSWGSEVNQKKKNVQFVRRSSLIKHHQYIYSVHFLLSILYVHHGHL